jgi:hypothetical protein
MLFEGRDENADGLPEGINGARLDFSEQCFEFGEHLFNRIEIRRVGGQEQEPRACIADHAPDAITLVAVEVVHDDETPGLRLGTGNCAT